MKHSSAFAEKVKVATRPLPPRLERIVDSFRHFAHLEATGGVLILAATILALILANSPLYELYDAFWHQHIVIEITDSPLFGTFVLDESLAHWINDGLMAVFFFVVGLEIKREVVVGELATLRKVMFPLFAAIGGMVLPALIYVVITAGTPAIRGWGIPMATDIAFALGVMALLGRRVPVSLKIFLTTFAIIDDIGAILVIALFYTADLAAGWLVVGIVGLAFAFLLSRARVYNTLFYLLIGGIVWLAFLESGIHPTIAGVLMAFTIPSRIYLNRPEFLDHGRDILDEMESAIMDDDTYRSGISTLETVAEHAQSPLQRLENALHPWVVFLILPVFALANAGVRFPPQITEQMLQPLTIAIVAGLVIGKQIGVLSTAWISVRLGLAELPSGLNWRHIYGTSWLAGIGFTVSLFIAGLAFTDAPALLVNAKLGILVGSFISGIGGLIILALVASGSSTEASAS